MKILTIGDSWTFGVNSSNPSSMSWPAQMARRYDVQVVNLARSGSSNQRAARIGIEELCRDSSYDYVIFPLAPADRTEVLKVGKWHQVWPNSATELLDKIYTDFWHPWNDIQNTLMLSFYFIHSVHNLGVPLYITGLSLHPSQYNKELSWITDYKDDNNFNSLDMPADIVDNISTKDLDRKLKSLRAIHYKNLEKQPEYFNDVIDDYFFLPQTQSQYGYFKNAFFGHPDDAGYTALADYFADKIGLTK